MSDNSSFNVKNKPIEELLVTENNSESYYRQAPGRNGKNNTGTYITYNSDSLRAAFTKGSSNDKQPAISNLFEYNSLPKWSNKLVLNEYKWKEGTGTKSLTGVQLGSDPMPGTIKIGPKWKTGEAPILSTGNDKEYWNVEGNVESTGRAQLIFTGSTSYRFISTSKNVYDNEPEATYLKIKKAKLAYWSGPENTEITSDTVATRANIDCLLINSPYYNSKFGWTDQFTIYINREQLAGTNLGYQSSTSTKHIFVNNIMLKINGSWSTPPKWGQSKSDFITDILKFQRSATIGYTMLSGSTPGTLISRVQAYLDLITFRNINYIPDVFFCLTSAGGGAGSNRTDNLGGGGGGAFYDFVLSLKALQESSNYEYLFVELGSGGKANTWQQEDDLDPKNSNNKYSFWNGEYGGDTWIYMARKTTDGSGSTFYRKSPYEAKSNVFFTDFERPVLAAPLTDFILLRGGECGTKNNRVVSPPKNGSHYYYDTNHCFNSSYTPAGRGGDLTISTGFNSSGSAFDGSIYRTSPSIDEAKHGGNGLCNFILALLNPDASQTEWPKALDDSYLTIIQPQFINQMTFRGAIRSAANLVTNADESGYRYYQKTTDSVEVGPWLIGKETNHNGKVTKFTRFNGGDPESDDKSTSCKAVRIGSNSFKNIYYKDQNSNWIAQRFDDYTTNQDSLKNLLVEISGIGGYSLGPGGLGWRSCYTPWLNPNKTALSGSNKGTITESPLTVLWGKRNDSVCFKNNANGIFGGGGGSGDPKGSNSTPSGYNDDEFGPGDGGPASFMMFY